MDSEVKVSVNRIKHLEEELANAQADKEFVWSLWRQLQQTNPDVTNAIGSVIQREKEKCELRDKKILEILRRKDEKISQLSELITEKDTECRKLNEKLKNTEFELVKMHEEIRIFEMNIKTQNDKEQMLEQMLRASSGKHEKQLKDCESEKQHLVCKLRDLVKEVAESNEREMRLTKENERNLNTIELLNTQIKEANSNYEKLMSELNNFKNVIDNNFKYENEKLKEDLDTKMQQNEKLKMEMNDLGAKLKSNAEYMTHQEKVIKQLKENQKSLHLTIKKQQETYQHENDSLKTMYDQLSVKYEQMFANEKLIISETYLNHQQMQQQQSLHLQQLKLNEKNQLETIKALQYEIDQLKLKNNLQQQQINDKQLLVNELRVKLDEMEINEPLKRSKSVCQINKRPLNRKPIPAKRSKSTEKERLSDDEHLDCKNENKLKEFYENLLKTKDEKLETITLAHQRRLERLISLEKENKLLKEYMNESDLDKMNDYCSNRPKQILALNESSDMTGYIRRGENDYKSVVNDLKITQHDNRRLTHENLNLKEKIDVLNVKLSEQNEKLSNMTLELNVRLSEQELNFKNQLSTQDLEIKSSMVKLKLAEDENEKLKLKLKALDEKCAQLVEERLRFTDLSTRLSEENKKLYKKWIHMRKNENKFKSLLIEKINKRSLTRKTSRKKESTTTASETNEDDFELIKLDSSSCSSFASSSCDDYSKKKKKNASKTTSSLLKKKLDNMNAVNSNLETKLDKLTKENEKLKRELSQNESKTKQLKMQTEHQLVEINQLKKNLNETRDSEAILKKQEEQARDELKKSLDSKIKQLTSDLNKQTSQIRNLRSENEKLNDKLKVNEEKLNHTDRDNVQKKQLIEFYKKKLEEFSKSELASHTDQTGSNEQVNELKQQIKKLTESNEKLKAEMKCLKQRQQTTQSEKSDLESKLNEKEKQLNELNQRYDLIKKDKAKLETTVKNSRQRLAELELYAKELEDSTELNIKNLSESSQETIALAQYKLKSVTKSCEDYESVIKHLYETLINRCVELRKEIKRSQMKKQVQVVDVNMKHAMDLASSVLNLTTNELEDILMNSSVDTSLNRDEDGDHLFKKNCQKLLSEFEMCLNKKDESANKNLFELVSQRLNDVLQYERELATIKNRN